MTFTPEEIDALILGVKCAKIEGQVKDENLIYGLLYKLKKLQEPPKPRDSIYTTSFLKKIKGYACEEALKDSVLHPYGWLQILTLFINRMGMCPYTTFDDFILTWHCCLLDARIGENRTPCFPLDHVCIEHSPAIYAAMDLKFEAEVIPLLPQPFQDVVKATKGHLFA